MVISSTSTTTQLDEPWRTQYPFTSHWHKVLGSHRMHYIDEGPKDAPVMLMVHGNPTWSFYYRRLIEHFSSSFRCIVPDHIGCGLSDKPTHHNYPYTLARRIEDLESLISTLDATQITLVVHDWGGAIGMGFAGRHPELLKRFVIFNTAAFRSERIPYSIDICRIPIFGQIAVQGFNGFARVAQWRAMHDRTKLSGSTGQGYLAPYNSWKNRVAIQQFVKDIPMDSRHPSYKTLLEVEEGLPQFVHHPMLIVWGERDFCFDRSFREEWQRRFPNAQVHALMDASHYVLEEAHERIIPWMQEFFLRHM